MLTDKDRQRDFGNPADPGIADQLGIKRQQAIGILRISARGRLPVDDATLTVEFANRIKVGNKFMPPWEIADHFDLKVMLRCSNADAIPLDKSLEQVDTLADQAVPGLTFLVLQGGITEAVPFSKEGCARILLAKQRGKSLFKATPEDHRRPRLLFPPPVEVAVAIAARATEVAAELGIAQDHADLAISSGT